MPVPKIKNIVIAVLLAANLVFLAIVVSDAVAAKRTENETMENLTSLCERSGISLEIDEIAPDTEAVTYAARRSVEAEKKIADTLLGDTEARESGGNVYSYTGERGTAVFRTGGEFSASIEPGTLKADRDPAGYAEKLLQEAGVSAETISVSAVPDGTMVLAVCTMDHAKIWNCTVEMELDGESYVREIEGRVFCGTSVRTEGTGITSAPTALIAFISAVKSEEASCTRILDAELGYMMSATPFGVTDLSPAWRITADTGEWFIDAGTGELLSGAA